jgi:uncharacterized protein YidB (DUF937 family)
MGLMDMVGGLMGKKTMKTGNPLLDAVLPMLMGGGALGGLSGLVSKFGGAGLGDKAQSWVGTGANEPIEGHEVEKALGTDTIAKIADQAGMSHDQAKGGLAALLPGLINGLTPGGSIPTGNIAGMMKGLDLTSILGGLGK